MGYSIDPITSHAKCLDSGAHMSYSLQCQQLNQATVKNGMLGLVSPF